MEAIDIATPAHNTAPFFSLINHPIKFRLYLLKSLPAAYFSGLKVLSATKQACTVMVPFKWFTTNPFRSTYFACLSMAAELSTGVLAMANVYKRQPAVSMLVTGVEGKFYKKATGKTSFTCNYGEAVKEAVDAAVRTGIGQSLIVHTIGKNEAGETVAEFWFNWSFKAK